MNAVKEAASAAAAVTASAASSAASAVGTGLGKASAVAATGMTKAGSAVGISVAPAAEQQQEGDLKIFEDQCKMSKTNRMIGFGVCMGVGFLLNIISFWNIAKPTSFALLFSFGNILSLLSMGFLISFKSQMKNMFDSKRRVSSIIFLLSLILTLVCAMGIPDSYSGARTFACIVFIVIQYLALIWYTASYIPFAQQMLSSMAGSCFKRGTAAVTG